MHQINIREATIKDLPVLLQFEQGIISAERPFDDTLADDPISYYSLEEMLRTPHSMLLVAELDGAVIGSGYARIEKSKHFLRHARHTYLGFMYVTPDHRGKGINKKIIDALSDWSIQQGISELRLEVYVDNLSAIKAYEKIGFRKHIVEMKLTYNPKT